MLPALFAAAVAAAQPVTPPALICEVLGRPFGPGLVKVTNIGQTPVQAGRPIVVTFLQAGAAGAVFPLRAPLPPGASQTLPLSGASLLARGCTASLG